MTKPSVEEKHVIVTTVPSGIEIEHEVEPHTYRIRRGGSDEWVEALSVTTALDVLAKGGLVLWAQKVGINAVLALYELGVIRPGSDGKKLYVPGQDGPVEVTPETLKPFLKMFELGTDQVRDKGGDRGNSAHEAMENWVATGVLPVVDFYPEEERGYIVALLQFLADFGRPKTLLSEVMVASAEHTYAGRFDLEAVLHDVKLCTKLATPKWTPEGPNHHSAKGPEYTVFNGRTLFDFKTSKDVYSSHHFQMALYEGARRECGYSQTSQQLVIRFSSDGRYVAVPNRATYEEALAVLYVYNAVKRVEKG